MMPSVRPIWLPAWVRSLPATLGFVYEFKDTLNQTAYCCLAEHMVFLLQYSHLGHLLLQPSLV
jgi:hypothetical protein